MGALLLHPSRRGPAGVVASWTSSPAGRDGGVGIAEPLEAFRGMLPVGK
ncbi:TTLL6 isoform 2 [Pan troglodytes]|uniref:Tubulin tyrosine ligase like 6 n=2 Tax=Homininae TaxID=207598 RepID=F6QD81_HUMAN|nr:TTLL6 isoform 2 [Pan troglodytes]